MILQRKECKPLLGIWSTVVWEEPASIEISGQALGNKQGSKLVYVQDTDNGKNYSSVEEHAISSYKLDGYQKGKVKTY